MDMVVPYLYCRRRAVEEYLTIIPHEPEWALSQYWGIDSEAMRARGIIFFSKIQLVGQKYRDKTTLAS